MSKKVPIPSKPTPATADDWVTSRAGTAGELQQADDPTEAVYEVTEEQEKMKRLTIDVPESLHRAIKTQCAMRGSKIADEVRELLLQKYGNH